jgi:hypothetical protein
MPLSRATGKAVSTAGEVEAGDSGVVTILDGIVVPGGNVIVVGGSGRDGTGGNWTCVGIVEPNEVTVGCGAAGVGVEAVGETLGEGAEGVVAAVSVAACFFLWDDLWTMGVPSESVADFFVWVCEPDEDGDDEMTVTSSSAAAAAMRPQARTATARAVS